MCDPVESLVVLQVLHSYIKSLALQETSRRFLNFTVPRVVAVSPQMRLVEDNPHSLSLLDVYKVDIVFWYLVTFVE